MEHVAVDMRKLKFRVWIDGYKDVKPHYEYFTFHDIDKCGCIFVRGEVFDHFVCLGCNEQEEHPDVEQFTGRWDIDGVEIYEGDVVETHTADSGVVVQVQNGWDVKLKDYGWLSWKENQIVRVIGNHHEHPELISGKEKA